ncbi:DUF4957 domain-containing protein [Pedobacter sp.]|uniref:DUF4957 domain-containing protein n=1 Tax=Pedobacter sp. TaxID=1411316 RepID=UPI003BAD83FD
MKINKSYQMLHLAVLLLVLVVAACTKTSEGFIEDPSTSRAFVPTNLRIRTAQDSAIITWNAGAQSSGIRYKYTLDISTDSLFNTIDYTKIVDTLGVKIVDPALTVGKRYFARLKANELGTAGASRWVYGANSFRIVGLQYLRVIRNSDITDNSVSLNWFVDPNTADLNKVTLTTEDNKVTTVDLSAAEAASGTKTVTGLTPGTRYTVQILSGTKSKGLGVITTAKPTTYSKTLNPGDNLATALTAAADGDIIGLNPGTYTMTAIYDLVGKSITLRSVSNNPLNTKIKLREINLKGDGAGINIAGIEIDANYSGTSFGGTFLQLKGATADGNATVFKSVNIENCIIHDFTTNVFRGNYGSAANVHRLTSFNISNTIIYDINKTGSNSTYTFSIEKLLFNAFSINRSTLYNLGAGLINMSTVLAIDPIPAVTFDYCTINNIGSQARYVLIDAGTGTNVVFNFQNSILANTPLGVGGLAVSGTPHQIKNQSAVGNFTHSNSFGLNTAKISEGGFKMVLTGLYQFMNNEVDLGWTAATRDFSLKNLPAGSPLLKGSSSGNTIGDPRWAY